MGVSFIDSSIIFAIYCRALSKIIQMFDIYQIYTIKHINNNRGRHKNHENYTRYNTDAGFYYKELS